MGGRVKLCSLRLWLAQSSPQAYLFARLDHCHSILAVVLSKLDVPKLLAVSHSQLRLSIFQ